MTYVRTSAVIGLAAAGLAAVAPARATALVHVQLSGVVSDYDTVFNGAAVKGAFPLGTLIAADLVIDRDADAFGTTTASGTVTVAGTGYAATGAYFEPVAFTSAGQAYSYASVTLDAPTVAPSSPGYQPGTLFFALTLPYPDPFATPAQAFPSTSIGLTFEESNGVENDRADLTVRAGLVTPIPEPASWALLATGFGAIGAALRRRRARAAYVTGTAGAA